MGSDQLSAAIKRAQATGYLHDGSRMCILCKDGCPNEPMTVGVFIADVETQRRLGCPEKRIANGAGRVVMYMLCPGCFERPSKEDEIEAEILKRVTVQ